MAVIWLSKHSYLGLGGASTMLTIFISMRSALILIAALVVPVITIIDQAGF
jgi:hypothetical protein